MMTAFELLKKYKASFILNECPDDTGYTKQIKFIFDSREQFIIKTARQELTEKCSKRKDISFVLSTN